MVIRLRIDLSDEDLLVINHHLRFGLPERPATYEETRRWLLTTINEQLSELRGIYTRNKEIDQ